MDVRIAEQNLEVEREKSEVLRKNLIDVSAQLEEIKSPLFVTSVKKGEVLLKNRKTQITDKLNLEMKKKCALGELQNTRGQWQRMDQNLQHFLNKTLSTFGLRMQRMAVQEPRLSPVTETTGS
ncbi:hypothetical protein AAFF_G00193260 [Aldrovandia affinis]|uniref:Uncharacterized protein n=1 Tax=Aldrovandia affinis TaxID=143900 RepID=A0AAD7VWK4_9TELE|nr:hypothetical protein AAFF_G00193260 [Aldrovandia affinis]